MSEGLKRLGVNARIKVIETAINKVAGEKGLYGFTAQDVADACEVPTSKGTVLRYFHTLDEMRGVVNG